MSKVFVALDNIMDADEVLEIIQRFGPAIVSAVNEAAVRAHHQAHERVSKDLNFPPGYLNNSTLKLRKASGSARLAGAVISARTRPTSLNRFAMTGQDMRPKHGLSVEVSKGDRKAIPKAFFMLVSNGNMAVAMRHKSWREIPGIRAGKYVWNGLVFLYGPSVDQVFKTHRPEIAEGALDRLEEAFNKLIDGVAQ